jgi:hypothetical protein
MHLYKSNGFKPGTIRSAARCSNTELWPLLRNALALYKAQNDVQNPFSIRKTMDNTRRLNDLALIPPDINRAASPMGQQIIEDR